MKDVERRRAIMGVLRAASLAASLLALAGASLPIPTRARTVAVLIDVSDSVGREGSEASRASALSLIRALEPRDRAAVLAFAGRAAVVTAPVAPAQAAAILESADLRAPSPDSTDLSAALAAASELAAKGPGSKTLYLFSDGRSNAGRAIAEGLAQRGRGRGIPVYAVPSGRAAAGFVAMGLSAPSNPHPGEKVALGWKVFSSQARRIEYELLVDGALASKGAAELPAGAGEIALAVDAGASGRRSVLVRAVGADGSSAAEAQSGAYLEVGGEAQVLIVSESRSPIAAALRAQGMKVDEGGAELLPEDSGGYSKRAAVVLDDLPALAMTEGQQARLQDYVAGGGGLLVVGGESSLGRGEYYATPLEEMLPVETDDRQRLLFTRAKLLFVIDHSGSMAEKIGERSKQMIAMRGVAASIAELNPLDEVGILGFDSNPSWVLPFTPASERERILASLSSLGDGGGTDLSVAVEEALRAFGAPGPTKRHAIVLTDGLTPEADFKSLAARMRAAGVSASTIAIGDEVNEPLLRSFAEECGGKYYRATEAEVPAIIDKETVRMTRDLVQEGGIRARITGPSPLVEGLGDPLPAVGGYLLTKAKSLATVQIEARAAASAAEAWDPLLSSWRYGNGRVAVFSSDSGKRWLSAWSGKGAYNRLWSQAVRSVERGSTDASLRASATVEGGNARVVVEARGEDRRALASLRLVGRSGGRPFALSETAPGRYEGYVPMTESGLVGFDLLDPVSGAAAAAWAWSPPSPESSRSGPDAQALSLIASATGGRLLPQEGPGSKGIAPPPAPILWQAAGLRLPLLIIAALLLVAELYLRSTMTGQIARAAAALTSWWEAQKALAELSRSRRWPPSDPGREEDGDRRYMEMQRKLAEHVARRYQAEQGEGAKDA